MKFSKILSFVAMLSLVAALFGGIFASAADAPETSAKYVYLYSVEAKRAVYEKASTDKIFPASTVKLMTALVVLENVPDLTVEMVATAEALSDAAGNSQKIKAGEILTARDLLYCMLVASANDAALVLAENVGGTVEHFIEMMNEKAAALGMENTHYTNPSGLHDEEQYTTAYDTFLVAKAVYENQTLMEICNTKQWRIPATNLTSTERFFFTTNHLISRNKEAGYIYAQASGMNAGYTSAAGYCLVSSAKKDELGYIAVVMGASSDSDTKVIQSFVDAKNLFEWAFGNFKLEKLVKLNEPIAQVDVANSATSDHMMLVPQSELVDLVPVDLDASKIERKITLDENVEAPVTKGQVLGTVTLVYDGTELGTLNLIAQTDLERSDLLYYFNQIKGLFGSTIFKIGVVALIVFVFAYVLVTLWQNSTKKTRIKRKNRF